MTFTMQFQDKFNALAKAANITDEEESVAKFFWYAGLRHAFQRGTSEAILLTKPTTSPLNETQPEPFKWNFPSKPALPSKVPATFSNDTSVYKGYDSELSPYEAKLISLLLAEVLSNSKDNIDTYERDINSMWKYCDKDDKSSEAMFKLMNKRKSKLNRLKGQINSLSQAQRKLKKISKGL